ncbi:hypothetical protein [Thiolapillus sp.]
MRNTRLLASLLVLGSAQALAEEKWYEYEHLYLQGGTFIHFSSSDDHSGSNLLIGLEAQKSNNWLYGLALFDNSFGQFSQYAYVGKSWDFSGKLENFHAKLTAGIIHGYREPWDDKIPLNSKNGWAPGLVPSFGYKKGQFGIDIMLLGNSGLLFTMGTNL